jgi:hypothetical protein
MVQHTLSCTLIKASYQHNPALWNFIDEFLSIISPWIAQQKWPHLSAPYKVVASPPLPVRWNSLHPRSQS